MRETTEAAGPSHPMIVSRRSAIALSGATIAGVSALAATSATVLAQDPHADHSPHDHEGHDPAGHDHGGHKPDTQHQAVIDSAMDCVAKAEACVAHCIASLAKGDTSLAECLKSVLAMMPMCAAVARLAALDAPRLKDVAKLCADICADCEKVCRKHEAHHAVCKACADSCARFVKESRKLTDA
ncbi:four-helix bundle copper-binding protein [Hyphomicrobium sp.]|uniref:four-helix bundle copper-binding protein n=1 Tax=Hyphomicrobium sp. TaxID=82 RepID=UPI002FE3EF8A